MFKKIFKATTLIPLSITFLFAFIYVWNLTDPTGSFFDLMDKKIIDFILKSRGTTAHGNEVVIATIDTKSVDKYGRWPWPRNIMENMVKELETHYESKVIGFDIVFSEKDQTFSFVEGAMSKLENKIINDKIVNISERKRLKQSKQSLISSLDNDKNFGKELKKWDNIVMGYFFFTSSESGSHLSKEEIEELNQRISGNEIKIIRGVQYLENMYTLPLGAIVEPNISEISTQNNFAGHFNVSPDPEDGTVRRIHLVIEYAGNYYPSLDLQVLRKFFGNPQLQMRVDEAGIQYIKVGNRTIRTKEDGSVMLNYKGRAETFKHYSIYDIINHKVPKAKLKDKIVLVGATEVGIFDLRTTPVQVNYPGVEVHATAIENMIYDDYFHQSSLVKFYSFSLILIFGIACSFILTRVQALQGIMIALIMLLGYVYANLWYLNNKNTWTSFVYVILTILTTWFAIVLYRFLIEEKDKRFIKGAFQQYLSPEVIDQLVDNPDLLKLGGERKELTAFFSDVQGFSTISESLQPEELVELLNEYLTEMTEIIMKYGGTVDKFEGDAIIAFFGAPIDYKDHATRSCLASLEMQRRLSEMRRAWKKDGKHELFMRIGLNTGNMVVGNMGSKHRMDYTMMGDSVNLAARLEGVNKQYKTFTMYSEFTHEQVKEKVDSRELDLIRVVGKLEPVRIYEVCCEKGKLKSDQKESFGFFNDGLMAYRAQDWDKALKNFKEAQKALPGDGPSQVYMKRTEGFQLNPPPKDWDGVFQMTSK